MLSAEQITRLFIGVEAPGRTKEQYGLTSMAEVIISAQCEALHGTMQVDPKFLKGLTAEQLYVADRLEENRDVVHYLVERILGGRGAAKRCPRQPRTQGQQVEWRWPVQLYPTRAFGDPNSLIAGL